jgi:hypothetical protein
MRSCFTKRLFENNFSFIGEVAFYRTKTKKMLLYSTSAAGWELDGSGIAWLPEGLRYLSSLLSRSWNHWSLACGMCFQQKKNLDSNPRNGFTAMHVIHQPCFWAWWLVTRKQVPHRGFNSLVMLVGWLLWKERIRRTFRDKVSSGVELLRDTCMKQGYRHLRSLWGLFSNECLRRRASYFGWLVDHFVILFTALHVGRFFWW